MDAFTAGISLIVVQFCVALVMTGVFFAAPAEKSTRYWALSANLVALGVVLAVLNRSSQIPILLPATSLIVAGMICQWHGIQVFYRQTPQKWGWGIGIIFLLLYTSLLILNAGIPTRSILLSCTLLILFSLSFLAIWQGQGGRSRSFVQTLVRSAIILLALSQIFRIVVSLLQLFEFLPEERSSLEIIVAYIVPIVGTMLFSTGLLLLYFERTIEENHHLATHDELSKLLNRRAIVAVGEREMALSRRLHRELTVAFIDIDLFKYFNDEFGHAAGDTVIVDISRIFEQTCRTIDVVGRYGGEEFLIILPGAGHLDAALIGERLVNAVRAYRFRGQYPVTVSVGLATLPKDDGDCSWDGLIRRADAALYEAKDLGRDRYCA